MSQNLTIEGYFIPESRLGQLGLSRELLEGFISTRFTIYGHHSASQTQLVLACVSEEKSGGRFYMRSVENPRNVQEVEDRDVVTAGLILSARRNA